jgi:hypothetical protein
MPESRCCAECFGDEGLRNSIIPDLDPISGTCSYCGSESDSLVLPAGLRDAFETLVEIYDVNSDGESLPSILRNDWALFRHPQMDDAHVKELLADILDDGQFVRQTFVASPRYQAASLAQWDDLRDEMMHRNRWFLDQKIDFDRLRELLDLLIADPTSPGSQWFRARILEDEQSYPIDKMGAPPQRLAAHGRANPAGIPYLYLGSNPTTAVAEVRPHTGEVACVAAFAIPAVRMVDLRDPRTQISPFILEDAGQMGQLRSDLPLLERLGNELTRPVLPRGAAFEYIPSQYLCEFIKTCGFDGVLYRSSVSEGVNLALFRPELASGQSVERYSVARVEVLVSRQIGP